MWVVVIGWAALVAAIAVLAAYIVWTLVVELRRHLRWRRAHPRPRPPERPPTRRRLP